MTATDLNNAVIWMVFTCPLIYKSSRAFTKPLGSVPRATITIDITDHFMFHFFFSFLARCIYLSLFSLSFIFTLPPIRTTKSTIRQVIIISYIIILKNTHIYWYSGKFNNWKALWVFILYHIHTHAQICVCVCVYECVLKVLMVLWLTT